MFSILVREELGYDMSILTLPNNNNNNNTMSDRDTLYQKLATCTTALYVYRDLILQYTDIIIIGVMVITPGQIQTLHPLPC